jgi:hypothetical protein
MSRATALATVLVLVAAGVTAGLAVDRQDAGRRPVPGSRNDQPPAAPFKFENPKVVEDDAGKSEEPPIQLTASDGAGLSLVALEANGLLAPPLAFTELHLTFENPRDAVIEGRFRIALPPGAALSRFALKIDGGWQEGEVVERQRARQAYEDFLHRKQDPALLEQEAGNEFSARVFPIPARGRKELIVSYSHALVRSDAPYVLPLQGLPKVGQLDVRVLLGDRPVAGAEAGKGASNLGGEVSDRRVVELHKRDWTPDRDFEIAQSKALAGEPGAARSALRYGNLAVARVSAPVDTPSDAVPQEIAGLYVLVDSSASRALGYAAQVRRVADLVEGLRNGSGGGTPLGVAAFDQEVVPIFEGRADGFDAAARRTLAARRPLGASDPGRALAWLGERLPRHGNRYPRVLLVTDGVATAGATETRDLKAAVKALGERGVERLDVLAVGGLRDEGVMRELVTGNLAHDGQRIDGGAPLAEIARRLALPCRSGIKVAVEGAAWIWPDTLDGVQPGDEALVYADLPADRPLRLTLAGRPLQLGEPAKAERPLLERAWAQARIERLVHLRESALAGDEDLRRALGLEIVEVSVKNRVLSPFTALLVLETENDYARFGLDRRALADILTVGPGGLDVVARSRAPLAEVRVADQPTAPAKQRQALLEARRPPASAEPEMPVEVEDSLVVSGESAIEGGVEGGVPGGVAGGVPGGVAGGTPGGIVGVAPVEAPRTVMAIPPPPAPPAMPAPRGAAGDRNAARAERPRPDARRISTGATAPATENGEEEEDKVSQVAPYTGRFATVMKDLAAGRIEAARTAAEAWSAGEPGDVLALLALGEAWEAAGEKAAAARAYGSLIDLFPSRADLRRLAGERLERLGDAGLELAVDTYRKAVEERPDHPSGHRLLAWALLRTGHPQEAFAALAAGLEQKYPGGRFAGVDQVLKEDLGLFAAAWLRAEPGKREEVLDRLRTLGSHLDDKPSLRFVLTWETDANDVDLHVYDRQGGHAFYGHKVLPSGGHLFADVTTGYGPECFALHYPEGETGAPYRLAVHYYSRGPMGYGMGTVQVVAHDGAGRLKVEPRPFVVMADHARVEMGSVGEGKAGGKAKGE